MKNRGTRQEYVVRLSEEAALLLEGLVRSQRRGPDPTIEILSELAEESIRRACNEREPQEFHFEGDKLGQYVDALNYLYPAYFWEGKTAKKEHCDLFGKKIRRRERYFQRHVGQAWDDLIRLSRHSMDNLVFALFDSRNWILELTIGHLRERVIAANRKRWKRDSPPLPFSIPIDEEE